MAISLLTGPQIPADLKSILNGLIQNINGNAGGVAGVSGVQVSPRSVNAGGGSAVLAADGNNSTPVITETYISEIFVPCNMLVTGVAVFNGSDVTGNVLVGLGSAAGAVLATSAATAGSGTDAYQLVPFTATLNVTGPATYYILTMYSSGTARYNTFAVGKHGVGVHTGQVFATGFTAFTPPTTFTTVIGNIAGLY
jgi:hypothetical protein